MIIVLDVVIGLIDLFLWSIMLYKPLFKRFWDIVLSAIALVVLFPLMLGLTILGAIKMKGNPFFAQLRPGKKGKDGKEKIFKLIKFRSMTCEKDKDGNLLPDEKRLTNYGKKLRATSLDELPELFNILRGDMSIVGPRPLLVQYLPYYTEQESHRHDIRPGLTGLAQISGRNLVKWDQRLALDVSYVQSVSLPLDLTIVITTLKQALSREGVAVNPESVDEGYLDQIRKEII